MNINILEHSLIALYRPQAAIVLLLFLQVLIQ